MRWRIAQSASGDQAARLNQLLDKQVAQLNAHSVAVGKNTISEKQYQAALRGTPAQLTDIFVSLQGGQRPMTVMLQQGGQLKDMFGGIVPAAKALGTTLIGLVNPYTVAAAGTAAMVFALK